MYCMYCMESVGLSSSTVCTVCTVWRVSDYQAPLHVLYGECQIIKFHCMYCMESVGLSSSTVCTVWKVSDYQVPLHTLYTAAITIAGVPVRVTVILHLEYGQQVAEHAHQENQTQNQCHYKAVYTHKC